jgi:hypothetical protein
MKKVFLSLVAVCTITTSFAQFPTFNEAALSQSGNRQEAYLTQLGVYNQATISQSNGSGSGYNLVNATQSGGSYSGERDVLWVSQTGSGNQTSINQLGANTYAKVTQSGAENIFSSSQTGGNRTSVSVTAQQSGNSNKAYIDQYNIFSYAAGPRLDLTQAGTNNEVWLNQTGTWHNSYISQEGNGNVVQGLGGTGSAALQSGISNTLTITQKQTLNTASVSQMGNGNIGSIFQGVIR